MTGNRVLHRPQRIARTAAFWRRADNGQRTELRNGGVGARQSQPEASRAPAQLAAQAGCCAYPDHAAPWFPGGDAPLMRAAMGDLSWKRCGAEAIERHRGSCADGASLQAPHLGGVCAAFFLALSAARTASNRSRSAGRVREEAAVGGAPE